MLLSLTSQPEESTVIITKIQHELLRKPSTLLSALSRVSEIKFIGRTNKNSIAVIDSDISLNERNHFTLVTLAQHFTLNHCYSTDELESYRCYLL